ncbi:hypothetical protein D3C72_657620 [compost metagenome]
MAVDRADCDVVVAVFNAGEFGQRCIEALAAHHLPHVGIVRQFDLVLAGLLHGAELDGQKVGVLKHWRVALQAGRCELIHDDAHTAIVLDGDATAGLDGGFACSSASGYRNHTPVDGGDGLAGIGDADRKHGATHTGGGHGRLDLELALAALLDGGGNLRLDTAFVQVHH